MIVRLTADTYFSFVRPTEWFFRIHGKGWAFRDHRVYPPLFSERYNGKHGIRERIYIHIGPYCIASLGFYR